jgi:hypothetical protein
MKDYEIVDNDIRISSGDKAMVSDSDATRQRLRQKLLLWRGEWFLDTEAGFPWLQNVLGQRIRPEVFQSLVRDVVVRDPGVRTLEQISFDFDSPNRRIEVSLRARATTGEIIETEVTI